MDPVEAVGRRRDASRVVFTQAGEVAHLGASALDLLDATGKLLRHLEIPEARGLTALRGGGVVVFDGAGSKQVCRLLGAAEPTCWPTTLDLTKANVVHAFADPTSDAHFWYLATDGLRQLHLQLLGGFLEDGVRVGFTVSRDGQPAVVQQPGGAFVVLRSSGAEVDQVTPAGAKTSFKLAAASQLLAPGPDASQIWLAQAGKLVRVALADGAAPGQVVALQPVDELVHTLAGGTQAVAAILIQQRRGQPLWTLGVWRQDGRQLLRLPLPFQPAVAQDDVSVGLSDGRVAVASATRVVVWDLATRQVVFDRAAP